MSGFPLCYNLIKKNQNPDSYRDKAADNFRAHFFLFAHALQLPRDFARGQTVMLTKAPCSKQEKFRYFHKFSEALGNPNKIIYLY
jgi:hypothetical protein